MPSPLSPFDLSDAAYLAARADIISGLRQLADYLEDHPDIPVNEFGWQLGVYPPSDTETDRRAEVDRIAAILAVPVDDKTEARGHYMVGRRFGRITYEAVCVPDRRRAAHIALMSYADAVTPDDSTATEPAEAA